MVKIKRLIQPIPCAVCGCNATHTRVFHKTAAAPGNPHHTPPPPRSDRPVNPSLRHHSWFMRYLVLLVIAAFVLAVYVVLHSTVLH